MQKVEICVMYINPRELKKLLYNVELMVPRPVSVLLDLTIQTPALVMAGMAGLGIFNLLIKFAFVQKTGVEVGVLHADVEDD